MENNNKYKNREYETFRLEYIFEVIWIKFYLPDFDIYLN